MPWYRKKPIAVEAIQWTGRLEDAEQMVAFTGLDPFMVNGADGSFIIPTLEGDHLATVGNFVIKGVKGEFYPCKPDIFAATYEPV